MKHHVVAFAAIAVFWGSGASFAQPVEVPPPPKHAPLARDKGDADCAEMRKACLNKTELGEKGEGDCTRYREVCKN